jgi:hypothetical protein
MSDNKLVISDEAVEAAASYMDGAIDYISSPSHMREAMRAALEAAAPYIAAEAWEEGVMYASRGTFRDYEDFEANPYRSQA